MGTLIRGEFHHDGGEFHCYLSCTFRGFTIFPCIGREREATRRHHDVCIMIEGTSRPTSGMAIATPGPGPVSAAATACSSQELARQ
jgi:hypothetical protein